MLKVAGNFGRVSWCKGFIVLNVGTWVLVLVVAGVTRRVVGVTIIVLPIVLVVVWILFNHTSFLNYNKNE